MKSDREITQSVCSAIDDCTRGIDEAPSLQYQIARKMKGEEPVSKKIFSTVILVAVLMVMTVAACAATNWTGITEFLGQIVGGWNVNEDAIVVPVVKENTSQWLKLTGAEAYWAADGLSIVLKVDAADDEHIVCYRYEDGLEDEDGNLSDQIRIGDALIPLDDWRADRDAVVCDFSPGGEGWTWYSRNEEGLFVIINSWDMDAEAIKAGTDLSLNVFCTNMQTGEKEASAVTITLPAMTMQEGHK